MTPTTSLRILTSAALASASIVSVAQTAAKPAVHRATTTPVHAAAPAACEKLPEMSPKIPAVPAGSPCAKALYTVATTPGVKLEYVSPLEGPDLKEVLGLESSTFSLDYIDTKIGTGALAAPGKWYSIHYTGYLVDGTKFDSSLDRGEPIVIQIGQHQVIPGWDTGFGGMHVGGKRRLFIPFQLAYGAQQKGPIPPRSELIFDVEFVAQSDTKPEPKAPPVATPPAAAKPGTTTGTVPVPTAQPAATPTPATSPAAPPPTQSTTPGATPNPASTTPATPKK